MNSYMLSISDDRKTIDVVQTYRHPKKVFGVRWNPFDKKQFATCCEDGVLRIFNSDNTSPIRVGKGHTAKIFTCAWNPVIPNVIATSSDDCNVIVWDFSKADTDQKFS